MFLHRRYFLLLFFILNGNYFMKKFAPLNTATLYHLKNLLSESDYIQFLDLCQGRDSAPFSWYTPGTTKRWEDGFSFAFYMLDGDNIHHNFKGPGILTYNHEDYGYCHGLYEILSQYLSQNQLLSPMLLYFDKDGTEEDDFHDFQDDESIVIILGEC